MFGSPARAGQRCDDKEPGSVRVVTPRFSPSPPLRSFLSINPRKSQRTGSLSLYVSSISSFSSSSPPFLILFAVSNASLPFPLHSVFPFCHFPVTGAGACPPSVATCRFRGPELSLARCPFVPLSLLPHPPLAHPPLPPSPPRRHGFCPRPFRR